MVKDNANTNIVHIEAIESLVTQIIGQIEDLEGKFPAQQVAKVLALKGLAKWQTKELDSLRRVFEE